MSDATLLDDDAVAAVISEDKSMAIAIVGMGFRGPADATDVERLWDMIVHAREGWSRIPATRWNNEAFYHPDNTRHGTVSIHFYRQDTEVNDCRSTWRVVIFFAKMSRSSTLLSST